MTGPEISQVITSVAALVAAFGSAFAAIGTYLNSRQIEKVRVATDGMKDELVAATAKGSMATGMATGTAEGHAAGLEQGRQEKRD